MQSKSNARWAAICEDPNYGENLIEFANTEEEANQKALDMLRELESSGNDGLTYEVYVVHLVGRAITNPQVVRL